MHHAASATGNLIVGAVRPAAGVLWRAARQPQPFDSPSIVHVGEVFASWPTRDLTGIHVTPSWVAESSRTADGLFVGRLERRAWLLEQRGTSASDHKLAYVDWDREFVDPGGLSMQVEEFDDADELVLSERIAFSDLKLPAVGGPVEVRLPTMGAKLRHGLSLFAPDGSFWIATSLRRSPRWCQ